MKGKIFRKRVIIGLLGFLGLFVFSGCGYAGTSATISGSISYTGNTHGPIFTGLWTSPNPVGSTDT